MLYVSDGRQTDVVAITVEGESFRPFNEKESLAFRIVSVSGNTAQNAALGDFSFSMISYMSMLQSTKRAKQTDDITSSGAKEEKS